jgi:DNA-binding CsgD family transcriptional regulator
MKQISICDGGGSGYSAPPDSGTPQKAEAELLKRIAAFGRKHHLSEREEQILLSLLLGIHPKGMAGHVGCSYETVRTHLKRMQRKLGCSGTREVFVRFIADQRW